MKEFFDYLSSGSTLATPVLIILGGVALIIVLIYIIAFVQGREVSFWPPKIGAKPEYLARSRTVPNSARDREQVIDTGKVSDAASPILSQAAGEVLRDPRLIKLVPPIEPTRFMTVVLPGDPQLSSFYRLSCAPTGVMVINHVPFFLQPVLDNHHEIIGHQTIDIAPGYENTPTVKEVPIIVDMVVAVHFLLSAGAAFVYLLGRQIGCIEMLFADNTTQRIPLVLGKHLREWAFENIPNLVRDIDPSITQPAWVSHNNAHRIDMMSITLDGDPKALKAIRIIAKVDGEPADSLPSIIISAITCERKTAH